MRLYINTNNHLDLVKEFQFKLEKEIQVLTEKNLKTVFGYDFVKSEFSISNFRIDTLAFDDTSSSFVIIEYKKDKNFSVIDQGYAYLSLMLNNKSDFILEYNENKKRSLKRNDVDWSQSKVIFISPSFTTYQREAINFKDLPIELWEIRRFSNESIMYNQIPKSGATESIKTISRRDDTIENVNKEIKVYTESEHIAQSDDDITELYERLKSMILNLEGVELQPKKKYIAFIGNSNIVDIHIQKKSLKLWINLPLTELDDPKQLTRDVSNIGHWGNGSHEIQINDDENLEYIMSLIKQSYKKNKK
ncbi:MAG: DUF5655 domain-containing protein [bacterium]